MKAQLLLLLVLIGPLFAQSQLYSTFETYSYGADGNDAYAADATDFFNGTIITTAFFTGAQGEDVFLEKGDTCIGLHGYHAYYTAPGITNERGYGVKIAADGDFWVVGRTNGMGAGGNDMLLLRMDSSAGLPLVFSQTFGGPDEEEGFSIDVTSDGGAVMCGYTRSFGSGLQDGYVVKVDAAGTVMWSKAIGGFSNENFWDIEQTSDGGYITTGYTQTFGGGGMDCFVVKLDALGNLSWAKTIGGADFGSGNAVQETADGGYIVVGDVSVLGTADPILLKMDALGALQWCNIYIDLGGLEYLMDVQQTDDDADGLSDDGYITGGAATGFGPAGRFPYYLKMDPIGNLTWAQYIDYGGGIPSQFASCMELGSGGGYLFTGSVFVGPVADFFMVRTKPDGTGDFFCPIDGSAPFVLPLGMPLVDCVPTLINAGNGSPAAPNVIFDLLAIATCIGSGWPGGAGCSTPLAKDDISDFQVRNESGFTALSWVSTDQHCTSFYLLSGNDPTHLEQIAELPGISTYYHDPSELKQNRFYQLRGKRSDGSEAFSPIREVTAKRESRLKVIQQDGEMVSLEIHATIDGPATIFITDVLGQTIFTQQVALKTGDNGFSLPFSGANGVYFLRVGSDVLKWLND